MHHGNPARSFRTDDDYRSPGWRSSRRDSVNDDVAPDDVSLLGPPTRSPTRTEADLEAYGYAGQGYPIYGQAGGGSPYDDPEPGWFADPASSAYAFGYTTSVRSNNPFPSGVAGGQAGRGPRDYQRADSRVLEDVCDRLSDDDEVDASDITVSVKNGEVTLEGTVADRYTKRRAEHIAASVRGVVDVHNQLERRKGLLRELGDTIAGGGPAEHQGHQGEGPHPSHRAP
jgi:osmotically-inducible protein OsmY